MTASDAMLPKIERKPQPKKNEESGQLEPLFKTMGDLYRFAWPSKGVEIDVSRLMEHHNDIKGEMAVFCNNVWANGLVEQTRLGLNSSPARRPIVSSLNEKTKGSDINWREIIDYACVWTVEAFRDGEPEVDLWSVEPAASHDLIEFLIAADGVTDIFAMGGSRKSTAAIAMGLTVSANIPILGKPMAGDICPVLYCDYEDSPAIHSERMRAICKAHGLVHQPPMWWRKMSASFRESLGGIKRIIGERNIGLGILDSASLARGSDVSDSDATIRMYLAMRATGIPWLLVDHVNRADALTGEAIMSMGSSTNHNSARKTLLVGNIGDDEADDPIVTFKNQKSNRSKKSPQMAFRFKYTTNPVTKLIEELLITEIKATDVPELLKRMPLGTRVLHEMDGNGAVSLEQLAQATGEPLDTIRTTLGEMQRVGKVVSPDKGLWGRSEMYRDRPDRG
jgi:hypothetical protein